MKNILCYGWYNHSNLGDELFKDAFKKLFPEYNFIFTDFISLENLRLCDVVFFGGGSFLNQHIAIKEKDVLTELYNKKILYIGVGLETDINAYHTFMMRKSSLIATRTKNCKLDKTKYNLIEIPDLVYTLIDELNKFEKLSNPKSILVLPNVSVVPRHNDPHWMHSAWEHFKTQMAQFLDLMIDNGYKVNFGNLCQDKKINDNYASYAISSAMINRYSNNISNVDDINYISKFETVITQRYHGIILSDMLDIDCIPIYHHDKLNIANSIPFYEISKHKLIEKFENKQFQTKKSIDYNAFNQLVDEVNKILKE